MADRRSSKIMKRRLQQKLQRQHRRQTQRCEECHLGREYGQLRFFCGCRNRVFHYPCLAPYLRTHLDAVCPHCGQQHLDRRLRRQLYRKSILRFVLETTLWSNTFLLVVMALLILAVLRKRYKYDVLTLIPIIGFTLAVGISYVSKEYRRYRATPQHLLLHFDDYPNGRGYLVVDITEEEAKQNYQLLAQEAEQWFKNINEIAEKVPPGPPLEYALIGYHPVKEEEYD